MAWLAATSSSLTVSAVYCRAGQQVYQSWSDEETATVGNTETETDRQCATKPKLGLKDTKRLQRLTDLEKILSGFITTCETFITFDSLVVYR